MEGDEELGLEESLIPKESVEKGEDGKVDSTEEKRGSIIDTSMIAVCVFAAVACAASAGAMAAAPVGIVFVAAGLCFLNAPTVVYRGQQLATLPKIRASNNMLRDEANRLKENVDILESTVDRLDNEVDDLKVTEEEFRLIAEQQGSNVSNLVALVKENQEILEAMKANLREKFVSEVIMLVMRSDTDGDGTISKKEGQTLALMLKMQLQPHGINLDTDLFAQMLDEDNTVKGVVKFCAEVLYPDIVAKRDEEAEKKRAASSGNENFFDGEDGSFAGRGRGHRGTFVEFLQDLSNMTEDELKEEVYYPRMSREHKYEMFTVSDKYTSGTVSAARGKKMTIMPGGHAETSRKMRIDKLINEAMNRVSISEKDKRRKTKGQGSF